MSVPEEGRRVTPGRHPIPASTVLPVALMLAAGLATGSLATRSAVTPAWACGACEEDKMAATYDHAVVTRATRAGQVVVFAALAGPAAVQGEPARRRVLRALERLPGVERGTVRISLLPAAASFAYDPARQSPQAGLREANRTLVGSGLSLSLLRILGSGNRRR